MGLGLLLTSMPPLPIWLLARHARRSALALSLFMAFAAPRAAHAQEQTDTLAVLAEVGRQFRLTATSPWVILADSPRREVSSRSAVLALPDSLGDPPASVEGYDTPSIPPRLARMLMAGTGPVRLLSRAPESPCDSAAMDASSGITRPWIGSSIRVTSLDIRDASATVVAQIDDGTQACRSMRDVAWWRYRLEGRDGRWSVSGVDRLGADRPPHR